MQKQHGTHAAIATRAPKCDSRYTRQPLQSRNVEANSGKATNLPEERMSGRPEYQPFYRLGQAKAALFSIKIKGRNRG